MLQVRKTVQTNSPKRLSLYEISKTWTLQKCVGLQMATICGKETKMTGKK